MSRSQERPIAALTLGLGALCLVSCATSPEKPNPDPAVEAPPPMTVSYPAARRGDVVEDYHGTQVADPYRWFETPDTEEVGAFIQAENALSAAYFEKIPEREAIAGRMKALLDTPRAFSAEQHGDFIYYFRNSGLQAQSILYRQRGLEGAREQVLDPNTFSEDGTVALNEVVTSPDGRFLAYAISDGGSDWQTWKVRDLTTLEDLPDTLEWIKFQEVSWLPDGSGFFYASYPTPKDPLEQVNLDQTLHFHRLGDVQADDRLVFETPDHPEWGFDADVSAAGDRLFINIGRGTEERNLLYVLDLTTPGAKPEPLVETWDAFFKPLAFVKGDLYLFTDLDAPKGRILKAPGLNPDRSTWEEVVPEAEETLEGAEAVGGHLIGQYLKDAASLAKVFTPEGALVREVALPGLGSLLEGAFTGSWGEDVTFYSFTSFTTPVEIFRYEVASGRATPLFKKELPFNPEDYVTRQVFYPSKDGTQIPMFISHRKDLEMTGDVPTLLYGYGGFLISITPSFSSKNLLWMEMGGILAIANIRGGGEYGREWHDAGTKLNKQNVFDDFIKGAEYLVESGVTQPARLAIHGGSNGGLLVGACLVQRPDLFGAALPAVGVLDMLRYHKFTIGWAWASDYGTSEDAEEFKALLAYSPVHNAKPGVAYPATLVTTGVRDDRVVPIHSYKFTAALQNAQAGPEPILLRVETRAGHGKGKPTQMIIDESADMLSFMVHELEFEPTLKGE